MVDNKEIACYVTADKNYVIPALIAILSFQRFFPNLDYFILTDKSPFDQFLADILKSHNISILYSDKHEAFDSTRDWPKIAFAMLTGPELFFEKGYAYSIGIDADILCKLPFDLKKILDDTKTFSGIVNRGPIIGNFRDADTFIVENDIDIKNIDHLVNPNTGFVIWNNQWAHDFQLSSKSLNIYKNSKSIIKSVDQGLLAGVILKYNLTYNHLEHIYNYRIDNKSDIKLSIKFKDILIIHYIGQKPWNGFRKYNKLKDGTLLIYFHKLRFHFYWHKFINEISLREYFSGFSIKSDFVDK